MAGTGRWVSDRERRLWLWTAAVVVGIYATLGLAGTLAASVPHSVALPLSGSV